MTYQNNTALLIDADNTSPTKIAPIIDCYYEPAVRRAYGNWCKPHLKNWERTLQQHGIKAVQQFDCAIGKNATDIALAVDAMELLHTGLYETFIIVASDSDYTPLVTKLRESGVKVIGIGQPNASEAYRNACTDFILVEDMMADIAEKPSGLTDDLLLSEEDDFLDTSFLFDEDEIPGEDAVIEEEDPFKNLLSDEEIGQSHLPLSLAPDGIWDGGLKEEEDEEASISLDDIWDTLGDPTDEDTDPDWPNNAVWETISTVDENGEVIWDTLDDDFPEITEQEELAVRMRSVHKMLQVAYECCKDKNGYALLSSIGNFIKEIRPEFDYHDYGFCQLHELLLAYPDQYQLVQYPKKVMAFRCCA